MNIRYVITYKGVVPTGFSFGSNTLIIYHAIIDIISEAPVMCLVFVEADYLVAVTYNMFYDFDDVLSFSKFFVKEHFSTK